MWCGTIGPIGAIPIPPPSSPLPAPFAIACYMRIIELTVYTDDQVIEKITVNDHMETNLTRYGQSGNSKI